MPGLVRGQQIGLDAGLVDPILGRGFPGEVFLVGRSLGRAVRPDRAAVEEVGDAALEGLAHHLVLLRGVADQVHHHVRVQRGHTPAPGPVRLLGAPVRSDPLDLFPAQAGIGVLGLGIPGDHGDLVAGPDQARDQVTADVTCAADNQ